jgi:N-acetyl-anhydromuramyl-L-alanine amidase AmpD
MIPKTDVTIPKPDIQVVDFPKDQYMRAIVPKRLIVLHHTVGGSATSTLRWWKQDKRRIATAFLIERDGAIYQVFHPQYWAWHLGVKDRDMERESVGIELANLGPLYEKPDGLYRAADDQRHCSMTVAGNAVANGRLLQLPQPWRGWRWWIPYPQEQIEAAIALTRWLCQRFHIPRLAGQTPFGPADLSKWLDGEGVIHHAMIRKDKSDLHPGFPWTKLSLDLAK